MKLLQAVVRFWATHARAGSGRGAVAVPRDFRVTVPAPLAKPHAVDAGTLHGHAATPVVAAKQNRNPATVLVAAQH